MVSLPCFAKICSSAIFSPLEVFVTAGHCTLDAQMPFFSPSSSPCIAFIHVFDTLNDVTEPGQNERNGNCGLLLALKQLPLLCRSPWGDGICQGDLAGGCQQLFGSRWVSMPPARSAAAPHRRRRWLSRRWLLRGCGLPVQERMIVGLPSAQGC